MKKDPNLRVYPLKVEKSELLICWVVGTLSLHVQLGCWYMCWVFSFLCRDHGRLIGCCRFLQAHTCILSTPWHPCNENNNLWAKPCSHGIFMVIFMYSYDMCIHEQKTSLLYVYIYAILICAYIRWFTYVLIYVYSYI